MYLPCIRATVKAYVPPSQRLLFKMLHEDTGNHWGSVVVKALRYRSVGPGIDSKQWRPVAADISVCPGVDSASKNEYHDIPGVKAAGA